MHRRRLRPNPSGATLLTLLLSLGSVPAPAQTVPDSGRVWTQVPAPTLAAVLGGAMLLSISLDGEIREELQERRGGVTDALSRVGNRFGNGRTVVPLLGASYLAGVVFDAPRVRDATAHAALAATLAGTLVTGLKYTVGRRRPNQGGDPDAFEAFRFRDSSFPSGHVALVFALATALARETGDAWSDRALFGAASLTAFSRMNDDKHWLSDVVAGAAIGWLAGRWATRGHGAEGPAIVPLPGGVGIRLPF